MAKSRPTIQSIYELCKRTFSPSGTLPPPPQAVKELCSLLDSITPGEVGLKEGNTEDDRGYGPSSMNLFSRITRWVQPITFIDIHECDSFTMCIFCFPTSSVIPLHDHPGMTVFSKVLYGSLHVKAYDWVEPPRFMKLKGTGDTQARLAKLAVDKVLTPTSETPVLYPKTGGNLHCFMALTPCAVLDILTPPYGEDQGRPCTYYNDYPYANSQGESVDDGGDGEYAWLAEIGTPDNLFMRKGDYAGPVPQA